MNHVFISYRRENDAHNRRVHWLAEKLQGSGLTVSYDEFFLNNNPGGPNEKWARWCTNQAKGSACVLIVGSPGWYAAFSDPQTVPGDEARGAAAEANVIYEQLYQSRWVTNRHRIILLDPGDKVGLPLEIEGWRQFLPLSRPQDLKDLIRWAALLTAAPAPPDHARHSLSPVAANLHFLCDRSPQMGALELFFDNATAPDFRRPVMVLVHGDVREAHSIFVERLCEYELPRKFKALGFLGGIERVQPKTRLVSQDSVNLAREIRAKITSELQFEVRVETDQQLIECFRKSRFAVLAPIFDFSSREAFAGERSYVEMLIEFWSNFPDLPPGMAVITFVCIKYLEPAPVRFFARMLSRKQSDPSTKLQEIIGKLKSEMPQSTGVRIIHKVLDQLGPVEVEDVLRWFENPNVSRGLRQRLQADAIQTRIFKGRPDMPMEHVLEELEKFI